jgi:DNA-binding NarL/FixJ family response regulator
VKILIADDQKHARNGLKALLRVSMPHSEILEAANGREAQVLAEEHGPDLVLMDVRMPEVDGLAATRWIRARVPQAKILVLSLDESLWNEALAAGADGFVSKGESPEALLARVTEILAGRAPRTYDAGT